MKTTFRIPKHFGRTVVIILLVLVLLGGLLLLVSKWEKTPNVPDAAMSPTVDANIVEQIYGSDGKLYQKNMNIETVLLLGIDKYEDDTQGSYINNQQADAIMLLVVDHAAKEYTVLQLNRDTITSIETLGVTGESGGKINAQLALAHAYGTGGNDSCNNTVRAVENLFYDIEIRHYASIKMDAISILNDAVGGVQLELMDDFTMLDANFEKGATVTLAGEQATAYVRYRANLENSTNIHRMERQKQYVSVWADTFMAARASDEDLASSILLQIQDYLVTNMNDPEAVDRLAENVSTYTSKGVLTLEGESVKGEKYMEFHVDEAALERLVLEVFYTPVAEN